MNDFASVMQILDLIADEKSTNEKIKIISNNANNELFCKVVHYALDPFKRFKMSALYADPHSCIPTSFSRIETLFEALDRYAAASGVQKGEKVWFSAQVGGFGASAVEIVNRILAKDLHCGANIKTFQKASPIFDDLPIHFPMKGIDDWDKFWKHAGRIENVCWSPKLDGTRTWAVVNTKGSGCVTYLSSNGKELPNFHIFDKKLIQMADPLSIRYGSPIIFDGEVTNISGDFSRHMSQFRRIKEMNPDGFRFFIFDIVLDCIPFVTRYATLLNTCSLPIFDALRTTYPWREQVKRWKIAIVEHLSLIGDPRMLTDDLIGVGLEGAMFKTWDGFYERKRSNLWCKMKHTNTEDLPVVGKVVGTGKYSHTLGALVVDRNGVQVEVGSGYTDAERDEFWKNPPKMIEVKYQDELASGSLRFPIFVRVREDKDPDSE